MKLSPLPLAALLSLGLSLQPLATSDAHAQPAPQEAPAQKGWLGVQLSTKNSASQGGVLVRRSIPASPAEAAGLVGGDIVQQVDGISVRTADEMIRLLGTKASGTEVLLDIVGPRPRQVRITLSVHPGDLGHMGARMIGRQVPQAQALNLRSGRPEAVTPSDGKVRIVEIWATWCGPCRSIKPTIGRLVDTMDSERFEFVGVASEDAATVNRFLAKHPANYRVLADPDEDVSSLYWTTSTPSFLLIDQQGNVVEHMSGIQAVPRLFEDARRLIERAP